MPEMFCFGRFQLDDPDCNQCKDAVRCANSFAGWGLGDLLRDLGRTIEIEKLLQKMPDWVLEWDNLADEELLTMAREQPE